MTTTHWIACIVLVGVPWFLFGVIVGMAAKRADRMREQARRAGRAS